jgi:hypothetical protein
MFKTRFRLQNEAAPDGDAGGSGGVLDASAASSNVESYTVESVLSGLGEDVDQEKATAYLNKYSSDGKVDVGNLVKSGLAAQARFGAFTGAPETYTLNTPDNYEGEISADDPYVKEFLEVAKDANMNQETLDKLLTVHLNASLAPPVDLDVLSKEIGADFEAMRGNMSAFFKDRLGEEEFQTLNGMITNSAQFNALYKVFQASKPTKIQNDRIEQVSNAENEAQMEQEYMALDDYGNRKMDNPTYAKAWRERWGAFIEGQ